LWTAFSIFFVSEAGSGSIQKDGPIEIELKKLAPMSSYPSSVLHYPEYVGEEEPRRMKQMTLRAFAEKIIYEEEALKLCPGCIPESEGQITLPPGRKYTAREFMKLPYQERDKLLAEAAEEAAKDYASDPDLNDFWAEDDIIEDY
jgi:hypothetical protein